MGKINEESGASEVKPQGGGIFGGREGLAPEVGENTSRKTVGTFIGNSPAFNSILETIKAIAARKCSVIISGETGVGKEMVAHQIHCASDRADKVFVPVRPSHIPYRAVI